MFRTIQIEKLALGLCGGIVCALLWMPQAMSAAKVTTPSGLQYIDLTVGNGDVAKAGDQVSVHYTGWLQNPDGSKGQKFDSSKELFTFTAFPASQWKALRTTNALERIRCLAKRPCCSCSSASSAAVRCGCDAWSAGKI